VSSVDEVAAVPPPGTGRDGAVAVPARSAAPGEPSTRHGDRLLTPRFWLVVASGTAYFVAIGMVIPVLPLYVERRLGGSSVAVGVAVGAFSFGAIALRPFAGRIGDRAGRRILMTGGAAIAGASMLLYTLADAVVPLIALRVMTGIGEAGFFVGASTMITDLSPPHRRGEALSYWSVAVYCGLAFGPALGEMILGDTRYSTVWVVAGLSTLLAATLGSATVDTLTGADREHGEAGGDADHAAAGAGRGRSPLLHRAALLPGSALFLGMVGLTGFIAFVPLYARDVGLADARFVFLLYGLLILGVRAAGARLPDALGARRGGSLALVTAAAGLALIAAWGSVPGLLTGTVVLAVGMSLLYPVLTTLALDGVPDRERASAMGTVSTFFDLAAGVGPFLLGAVVAIASYRVMFGVGAAFSVLGLVFLRGAVTRPRAGGSVPGAVAVGTAET